MIKFLLPILILFNCVSFSQQGKGIITGVVKDLKSGQPIPEVLVRISQTKQSTYTNEKGEFKFENLNPGPYTLRLFHKNFSTLKVPHQEVFANSTVFLPLTMVQGSGEGEGSDDAFFIGGMEVVAKKNVLPDKVITTHEINSGQIEHMQASNLGDIMQLIPGVGQMKPGLADQAQVALRGVKSLGVADDLQSTPFTLFGTKIMVDGSAISNNANMNHIGIASGVQMSQGSGVDLRGIPADNIESVEVLTGVASAKYGDFTEGVVIVKTKSGYQPQRVKVKSNPTTSEFNFNGGINLLEGMNANYNFNLASTTRNIRREGDSYERLAGQLKLANTFFEDKSLNISNGFYFTKTFDDYKDVKDPVNGLQTYNHTYSIMYNNEMTYKIDNFSKIEFRSTINYINQDKFKQDMLRGSEIDSRYITNAPFPSTYLVPRSIGSYLYQATEKGNLWTITAEGEWSKKALKTGSFIHNLSAGIHFQYDDNTGEGYNFDLKKPPNNFSRPFSYDATPANDILSVYAEDEIHGVLLKPFTLGVGLRYEMFSPQSIDWKGLTFTTDFIKSRSGSFLQPRISFKYFLSPDTRIRFAFGVHAKSLSMNLLYPGPYYKDVRDYYGDSRDISDTAIFTTYVFNRNYGDVRGYTEKKYELSFDQKLTDDIGLTIRGYYSNRDNELVGYDTRGFIPSMTRPNFPNIEGGKILSYALLDNKEYYNNHYTDFRGIDFIITTKKIEAINSSFYISGSYGYSQSGTKKGIPDYATSIMKSSLDSLKRIYHAGNNLIPVYMTGDDQITWYEKIMITYRWEFTVRKLGLWVTLSAQQVYSVKTRKYNGFDRYAIGYVSDIEGGKFIPYGSDVPQEAKLRTYLETDFKQPITDTWNLNINVSKSLYKGAEVSFFVNNFLDRYNDIFYGLEFSIDANKIFN